MVNNVKVNYIVSVEGEYLKFSLPTGEKILMPDHTKYDALKADNAALRKLLESCSEKLSYSIYFYDMELVNLIEQTLSKGKTE
jgi:hypothetical protein